MQVVSDLQNKDRQCITCQGLTLVRICTRHWATKKQIYGCPNKFQLALNILCTKSKKNVFCNTKSVCFILSPLSLSLLTILFFIVRKFPVFTNICNAMWTL